MMACQSKIKRLIDGSQTSDRVSPLSRRDGYFDESVNPRVASCPYLSIAREVKSRGSNFVLTLDKRLKKTRPNPQWCGCSERLATVRERQSLGADLLARDRPVLSNEKNKTECESVNY